MANDDYNEDWLKTRSWDLPAETWPELAGYLERTGQTPEEFLKRPVALAIPQAILDGMPASLRKLIDRE